MMTPTYDLIHDPDQAPKFEIMLIIFFDALNDLDLWSMVTPTYDRIQDPDQSRVS